MFDAVWARVLEQAASGQGWQELIVELEDPLPRGLPARGLAFHDTAWWGEVAADERVLLNVTAVRLGLGTGGRHFVAGVAGRGAGTVEPSGHLLKLRYTPWQFPVMAVEERLGHTVGIAGLPVAVGELHSQLGPAAVAAKLMRPGLRLGYIMTDGGALPACFSRQLRQLRHDGWLEWAMTCGQAYGGDWEAITPYGALQAAREVLAAEAVIVAMGPGILGTGTPLGHSGSEQALWLNAVARLGGRPILIPRLGRADARPRHIGVSHHTLTNAGQLTSEPALVALPADQEAEAMALWQRQLAVAGVGRRHALTWIEVAALLPRVRAILPDATTMGRGWDEEPGFFAAAVAAGALLARLA